MPRKKLPKGEKTVAVSVYVQEKVVDKLGKEFCQDKAAEMLNKIFVNEPFEIKAD